ncbi:hypothetical protein DOY81_009435 [Sarcophaga bullata]|nr:hypothetical protein DOY81_009435 [Sarcophaga bullata]
MTGFDVKGTCLISQTKAATNGNETNGSYTARENASEHQMTTTNSSHHNELTPTQQVEMVINEENYSYEVIKDIADYLLQRTSVRPVIGIICGSGLSSLADNITDTQSFAYEDIPNFPVSTVEGHVGRLIFGYLEGLPVMAMQGAVSIIMKVIPWPNVPCLCVL